MAAVAATRAPMEQLRTPVPLRALIQRIDGQAAQRFGEEIAGPRPRPVDCAGCPPALLEEDRVGGEADLCLTASHLTASERISCPISSAGGRQAGPACNPFRAQSREAPAGDRAQAAAARLALPSGERGPWGCACFGFGSNLPSAGA